MFIDSKPRQSCMRVLSALIAVVIIWSACVRDAQAGERKFIVMLANSPKQFGGNGLPPGGLVDRATIDRAYFSKVAGDGLDSFSEYWEEISYGDVTVAGITTDWISLPWSIQAPVDNSPSDFTFLRTGIPGNSLFLYGASERFNSDQAMVLIDIDGDPDNAENGPFPNDFGPGGSDTGKNAGSSVWMPGQRFLDIDGDLRWDGLDEINNQMDHNQDGRPDLLGKWVDLDGDGQPNNIANCIFVQDSDNDGNPDCCPDGPGLLSCGGIMEQDIPTPSNTAMVTACPPTTRSITLQNGQQLTLLDCNGNGIPDACDVPSQLDFGKLCEESPECIATGWLDDHPGLCGTSPDILPLTTKTGACTVTPDGIPDECQFINWDQSLNSGNKSSPCTSEPADTTGGMVVGCPATDFDLCVPRAQNVVAQCEFNDINGDNAPDVVEPFEAFLRLGNHLAIGPNTDPVPGLALDFSNAFSTFATDYITNNYPGHADKVLNQSVPRQLWGQHDPFGNLTSCSCADGMPCRTLGTCEGSLLLCETSGDCPTGQVCNMSTPVTGMCPAGAHLAYTSPDRWFDATITTKMVNENFITVNDGRTPRPIWYEQAWRDRYPTSYSACRQACAPNCVGGAVGLPGDDECIPVWNASHAINPRDNNGASPSASIPLMTPFQGNQRRFFNANRGGLSGAGLGWIGADNADVDFRTGSFEAAFATVAILPEEMNGINSQLVIFDGIVEHDDLPSSKYHQGGDQRLGEVTSPFSGDIWGEDLAPVVASGDGLIAAAGPYATRVSGNLDSDAGNVLSMEVLTWRWEPPFNDGQAWDDQADRLYRRPISFHKYASLDGENLGFRDYNLDGLIDQGEVRPVASENYLVDAFIQLARVPGTQTAYPWNRQRLLEDCVETLDSIIDFDDFVDSNALDAAGCAGTVPAVISPTQFGGDSVDPLGAVSGIVLLPNGSHIPRDFLLAPLFYPIHNQDASDPRTKLTSELNWNLVFHDLVIQLGASAANDQQVSFSAHEYLHSWEGYPDLYDYDIFLPNNSGAKINAPVGGWDIMAVSGITTQGYVHPSPILKESVCSRWIEPVDLSTILTPGVDTRLTLPPSEFVRDDSHFFLENEDVPGERYYFWSVGSGIDTNMPGTGMLVQHTDVGGNREALPSGQQNATRFQYLVVQADGLRQLEDGSTPNGDAGDPFPGTTRNTSFTCDTNPASKWYTFNTCIGLSVTDIREDGSGSTSAVFNLVPTGIPSLQFLQPAGGKTNNSGIFSIRIRVTDSFGGTFVRLYYTTDNDDVSIGSNFIGEFRTTTPGTNDFSLDWDINGLPDGQYFVFAELEPSFGVDNGIEKSNTSPRGGRNNKGDGSLTISNVNNAGKTARFETWVVKAIDAAGTEWVVNSSLSQPNIGICIGGANDGEVCDLNTECASNNCNNDRFAHAFTGVPYTSVNNEVSFTINEGAIPIPFTVDDTFVFSTTGITAASAPVTIISGRISDDPIAIINAAPLSGNSPLIVQFDGRQSTDPRASQGLEFQWDFGDGSSLVTGTPLVTHTYNGAQTFTAKLSVTNSQTSRVGEASVDIILANNSPNAVMSASPLDGLTPLTVNFSSVGSSDNESDTADLVFEWDFGDGETAGTGVPGEFTSVNHIYFDEGDNNGRFTAALTVTDPGGKRDTVTLALLVGNTRPVPVITTTPIQLLGSDPFIVTFDATNSVDADGDGLTVVWTFDVNNPSADNTGACNGVDDCTQNLSAIPTGTDGSVEHTYRVPNGQSSETFTATAVITDTRGASMKTSFNIVVNEAPFGSEQPRARFSINTNPPLLGVPFTADASASFDSPDPNGTLSYSWDWGDTNMDTGVTPSHTFINSGRFAITLTVTDTDGNVNSITQIVTVADNGVDSDNRDPVAIIGTGPRSGSVPLTIDFNGLNSFDLDGDPLAYTWQFHFGVTLVDTLTGPTVTKTFDLAGTYTVTLLVSDGLGGLGISNARIIEVDPRVGASGGTDVPPGQTTPGETTTPTTGICGLGMLTSMFGSLVGLLGMMATRRRRLW